MYNSLVFSIAVQMSHASHVEHFIRYDIVLSLQECDVNRCHHRGTISMILTCNNVRLICRSRGEYTGIQVTGMIKGFFWVGKFGKYIFGWLDASRDFLEVFKTI